MKNVIVISSSMHANSTSKILAEEVLKGLKENNNAELIDLKNNKINFCIGCLACAKTGKCVFNDDMQNIIPKVKNADIIVFASPVYFYSIPGQLKTFIDRLNPLYEKPINLKKVYAVFTCADSNITAIEGPQKALQGWIDCCEGVEYAGSFNGLDITDYNDITLELKQGAYEFGKNIK